MITAMQADAATPDRIRQRSLPNLTLLPHDNPDFYE